MKRGLPAPFLRGAPVLFALLVSCGKLAGGTGAAGMQGDPADAVTLPTVPAEVYAAVCVTCHGENGQGAPAEQRGFDLPMPDFTDCNFATREGNSDWVPIAARGGPTRAFSRMMPAMGDAMTEEEIETAIAHIRRFCGDPSWPRGELNLPRALYTTKAFPEDEVVVDATWDTTTDARSLTMNAYYEKRVGSRGQFEVIVPLEIREDADQWDAGVGDLALGYKAALWHDLERGYIVSPGVEVVLPTGDEDEGFGSGTVLFEPFLAYGQLLPDGYFVQSQVGGALPLDGRDAQEEVFARAVVGRAIYAGGYGRRWTPMMELLWSDALDDGVPGHWDLAPQLQVTLSARQHVRLGAGVRLPLNDSSDRSAQVTVFLLWDWFDGGLLEGWNR